MENDILDLAAELQCQELHFVVDQKVDLKAVIAIHNTTLGPALGGCRCREYPSTFAAVQDAVRLARGMTYKAAISNLPLGGGNAVLLKPSKINNRMRYFRHFGRFLDTLHGRYITAVDSGTSTADMDAIALETTHVTNTSTHKLFSLADPSPMTAQGVIRGIEAAVKFKLKKDKLKGLRILVQGLGHAGTSLVERLHEQGAQVIVYDINPNAMIRCQKTYEAIPVSSLDELLNTPADVFAPCALGGILNDQTIPKLKVPIVAGIANNQLAEDRHGDMLAKANILYAPDYVINAGGLIYVSGQYTHEAESTSKDRINHIYQALTRIFECAEKEQKPTHWIANRMVEEKLKRLSQ